MGIGWRRRHRRIRILIRVTIALVAAGAHPAAARFPSGAPEAVVTPDGVIERLGRQRQHPCTGTPDGHLRWATLRD